MTENADAQDTATSTGRAGAIGTIKEFSTILAPITLLTALLYFFGYLRARAFYSYFGLDLPSIGFSMTDYLVLSADTVFRPLAVLLAIALGAVVVHIGLTITLDRADIRLVSRTTLGLAALGAALLLTGVTELAFAAARIGSLLVAPIALIAGAVCLEYATHTVDARKLGSPRTRRLLKETKAARRGLVIALVVFSAFWATSDVAHREGVSAARVVATTLPIQTKVVIYSRERLQLIGPGVQLVPLTTANSAYHYRYNGLRLLLHNGSRWFILRAKWTPEDGQGVIILQDDQQQFRIEVAP